MNIYKLCIEYDKALPLHLVEGDDEMFEGSTTIYSVTKFSEDAVKEKLSKLIVDKTADKNSVFTVTQTEIPLAGYDGRRYLKALLSGVEEMLNEVDSIPKTIFDENSPHWRETNLTELVSLLKRMVEELPSDKE